MQSLLKNITLIFFPANTTSHLQPLDQGIINSLKSHYRGRMLRKVIAGIEADGNVLPPNLLDAVNMIAASWHLDVTSTTISNCFKQAGLWKSDAMANDTELLSTSSTFIDECDSLSTAVTAFINLVGVPSDFEQSDFENIDNSVVCAEPLHSDDQSIVNAVNGTNEEEDEEIDEERDVEDEQPVAPNEALEMVAKLRTFFVNQADTDLNRFVELDRMESEINRSRFQNLRQASITDFFQR